MSELHCLIATAFLVASIYMSFIKNKEYENTLNETQKNYYKKVVNERKQIYIKSILYSILGCLALFLFIERKDNTMDACLYTFVFFMIQYFVYILVPKKFSMLDVVEDNEDAKQWLDKYKYMQRNWHYGLLLGVGAFLFFTLFLFESWDGDYTIGSSNDTTVFIISEQKESTPRFLRNQNRELYNNVMDSTSEMVLSNTPQVKQYGNYVEAPFKKYE
jgi:hypothetical protein